MGGCEIDLRHASMPEGRAAVLDTFAFWGGIEIRVPDDWEVVSQGSAVLGAFVNNARSQPGAKRRLLVTGPRDHGRRRGQELVPAASD